MHSYFATKEEYQVLVVNTTGQTLLASKFSGSFNDLHVHSLKDGIYFLKIYRQGRQIGVEKFVKN